MITVPSALEAQLLSWFRQLHRHPEISQKEFQTTALIRQALSDHGVQLIPWPLETGALAVIRGEKPGPVIALRADIDALPIQEETGLPYASEVPGIMHACGHDFHTAMMLGAALLLQQQRDTLPGTVKIVFQPDEEYDGGAARVQATGLLNDACLLLAGHTYPHQPAGWLGIREGSVMAAADFFSVTLRGQGTHAGNPHLGTDPIPALGELLLACQTVVSRKLSPFTPAVLSVGHVQAGTTWNVIPETALLEGTARAADDDTMRRIRQAFAAMVEGICHAHGITGDLDWKTGAPAVLNDPALCRLGRETAARLGLNCGEQVQTMGAEDLSFLIPGAPRLFVRVGTGGGIANHHPKFTVDPAALAPAAVYFAELAKDALRYAAQRL